MGNEILVCLAGLVTGILASCGFLHEDLLNYLIPLMMAVLASILWKPGWFGISSYQVFSWLSGFCCFFLTGWILVSTNRFQPGENQPAQSQIIAKVVTYREVTEKMGQLVIRVKYERNSGIWERRTGRMVLVVKPDKVVSYNPGDIWQFGSITITAVSAKPTKNGFIPRRYWLSRGVSYEARLVPGQGKLVRPSRMPSLLGFFGRWQQTLSDRVDRIALSESSRSLVKAMILGDRSDVSSSTMTDFSRAGIIHVLSVSGLHVGIIYFIIAWLLRKVVFLGTKIRSVLCLCVVWLYAGVTGFSPSALRSAGMITLFEFSKIGRRGTPGLEVLTGTAVIHCLIDPYTVFSAGAQLSYLAVAGIFIWNPVFNRVLVKLNRFARYFAGSIAISLAAQSLITPVLLFWFGWFPLYFLIGNMVLLPLMVFSFYLGLVITILDFARLSIPLLCKGMDAIIGIVMNGAGWLGNLPGNLVKPEGLVWSDLVLYYLILFSIRLYCDKPDPRIIKRILAGTGFILLARYTGILILG
ncbi:MAG: ComEC/Rec2 family competence protein [Bacteroidia bacterium]|nr:ComEC/Rec2 family competence protein [Bacteroidia bacterium]